MRSVHESDTMYLILQKCSQLVVYT